MCILALGPLGTEASQVVGAEDTANVTVATVRPVPAETSVIPRTVSNLTLRVDVKERALLVVTSVCSEECVSVLHTCICTFELRLDYHDKFLGPLE